jgi:hypothetical protein
MKLSKVKLRLHLFHRLDPETAGQLPFQTLTTSMFRARRKELGLIPASLEEYGQALEGNARFGRTKRGEEFYRYLGIAY